MFAALKTTQPRAHAWLALAVALLVWLVPAVGGAQEGVIGDPLVAAESVPATNRDAAADEVFDPNAHDLPTLVEADYIELPKIASISKFRSAAGHDYSDAFESCRSMKHYFRPSEDADWASVRIF